MAQITHRLSSGVKLAEESIRSFQVEVTSCEGQHGECRLLEFGALMTHASKIVPEMVIQRVSQAVENHQPQDVSWWNDESIDDVGENLKRQRRVTSVSFVISILFFLSSEVRRRL